MLLVTRGPFHPSLEAAFVARLGELKKGDPLAPVVVVAPSARLSNRLKELALAAFPDGAAAIHFHHLMSFARLVAGPSAPAEDEFLLERLAGDLVTREFPNSLYLKHAAGAPRLARSLLDLLLELREGGVDPDDAYAALGDNLLGEEDRLKLGEIFALLKAYETELKRRGWTDRADVVKRAAERAPESVELAGFKEILYYGVVELVQVQIELLRAISSTFPTRLFHPGLKRPGYEFSEAFFVQVVQSLAGTTEALTDSATMPKTDVVNASGARDEVWAACKRLLEWRADGAAFDEMGVVARNLAPYVPSIETLFRDHKIPFRSSAQKPLDGDPYVSAARLLLTLSDAQFPRGAVIDLLASPHFRHDGPRDPVLWDAMSRALGIGLGAEEWRRRLPKGGAYVRKRGERGEERELDVPAEQVESFRRAVERLIDRAAPPLDASWSGFAAWALALFRDFLVPGDATPRVLEAFERLVDLGRVAGAVSGEERRDMALRLLADLRVPLGSDGGVQVLDAMSARGIPFRRLIVLGLNERVFPRFILEDPFVRDAVRTRIATRLGPRLPSKLKGYDEERLLFTLLRESAAERLVLSWQRSDEKGRTRVRSTFLEGDGIAVPRPPAERFAFVAPSLLTRKEAALIESLSGDRKRVASAMKAFGAPTTEFNRRAEFLKDIDDPADDPGPWDGRVSTRIPERVYSPTSLESFVTCPFQYFAQRVLRLQPLDEPGEDRETSPLDEGSLLHGFLQEFHTRLRGKLPATLEAARPEFESALSAAFARLEAERSIRHPIVWESEKARIRRTLEAAVAWDLAHLDGFVPSRFEEGMQGEIKVGPVKVKVGGFVDRLDLRPDGAFRVIDYKRSRSQKYNSSMATGVRKGRYFQPPIYFLLAEQALKKEGGEVYAAGSKSGYLFLRELAEGEAGELWLEGGLGDAAPDFQDRLGKSLASIGRGEFVVRPGDHCKHCDFRTACRKQHTCTRRRAEKFHEDRGR